MTVYACLLIINTRQGLNYLFGLRGKEGDQIVPVLLLLESTECHLRSWDILLWVLEVLEQGVVIPLNTLRLVGICVGEALDLTSVTAEQPVQVGTDLVSLALAQGVTLCAAGFEKVGTLLCVSCSRDMSVKVYMEGNAAWREKNPDHRRKVAVMTERAWGSLSFEHLSLKR